MEDAFEEAWVAMRIGMPVTETSVEGVQVERRPKWKRVS
jgi:hypothetical protein